MTDPSEYREKLDPRELQRVALESIGDGVITTDPAGCITFLNGVAEMLTGWSAAQAVGVPLETVFRILDEETRRVAPNPAARALGDNAIVVPANPTVLIARDGTERHVEENAAPIRRDGETIGVVLVFRDISERREAERHLRQSEERFRLLVECVQDYAIFMLDANGRVVSWNLGAERIKGYSASEILGSHLSRFYPREAVEAGWPDHELKVAARVGRFEDEGWRVRQDGTTFWANVVITAIRDRSGKLKGFAKVTRDLTQRRQLERARAQAEAFADLDRRRNEFLAMLSHELRNPLAPILSAVHLLRLQPDDNPMRRRAVAVVERQVGHLTRLIDDLLEASRITSGRISLQLDDLDVRAVIERAVESTRPLFAAREIELSVALPAEPVWLRADQTRLEQVVLNLLGNAVKFTEPHGHVAVRLAAEDDEAVLRVADDGIGIDADLLPRIFDPFTQGEHSLDRPAGAGLGVGLTIVRRVVEMHGGQVEAISRGRRHGSEFVVRLPATQPDAAPKPAPPTPPLRDANRLRVLIVDDNRDAADTSALVVQQLGHDVRVAYAGSAALELAFAYRPDVVLLDIGLPEVDGYEVARRIRASTELRSARLIAVTGYGQPDDRARTHDAGFDAHVVKPLDPLKLEELLAQPA